MFEDETIKNKLMNEFGHKVSLRKISDVYEESKLDASPLSFKDGGNDLALCDISVIGH